MSHDLRQVKKANAVKRGSQQINEPLSLQKDLVIVSSGSSSDSNSETSSNSSDDLVTGEATELIARCVELPKFLLSHSEYSDITVP